MGMTPSPEVRCWSGEQKFVRGPCYWVLQSWKHWEVELGEQARVSGRMR